MAVREALEEARVVRMLRVTRVAAAPLASGT
jgi:hypothetical protein